jgi:hypothetical protein
MAEEFPVRLSAGTLRADDATFVVPHAWTGEGIAVEGDGTGAHLLHAAVAACILNDIFREAQAAGRAVDGVVVLARGGFGEDWCSTGVSYEVELDTTEDEVGQAALLARVDEVAEIPRAVRVGARVERAHG